MLTVYKHVVTPLAPSTKDPLDLALRETVILSQ